MDEDTIRDRILQSPISHPRLYEHQANALLTLFKVAGATFEAHADPTVVDRCFEFLENSCYSLNPVNLKPLEVRTNHAMKSVIGLRRLPLEAVALRESNWEDLPSPPIFTTAKPEAAGANRKELVTTSPGLPSSHLEPQVSQPPPPKLVASPDSDTMLVSRVTPVARSPSIDLDNPFGLTFADTSHDEHSVDPAIENALDGKPPIEPMAIVPYETFYLAGRNVEIVCENKLFRVHIGTLFSSSPVLRQMLAQTKLDKAESSNGCPRIPFPGTAMDLTTLLKMIYFPGFLFHPHAARLSC